MVIGEKLAEVPELVSVEHRSHTFRPKEIPGGHLEFGTSTHEPQCALPRSTQLNPCQQTNNPGT